ncbi:hypothetical protein ACFQ1M_11110 [Sungkyunkwania multivorans]|uniref:Uncharacterized protein n=1 Tax=Sungkyunkwania multivorans TaxID=1173618 RepID=A0ABW3CY85_9FLAO
MKHCIRCLGALLFCALSNSFFSCEDPTTIDPLEERTTLNYSESIPGKARFEFIQTSELAASIAPFKTQLSIQKLTEDALDMDYTIYVFKDEKRSFENLDFIYSGSATSVHDTLTINEAGETKIDTNTIEISLLRFGLGTMDISGNYKGEVALWSVQNDSVLNPEEFFVVSGYIDMDGQLELYAENETDTFRSIRGIYNSSSLFIGSSKNDDEGDIGTLSSIQDSIPKFSFENDMLRDTLSYSVNNQQLSINIIKQ